MSVIFLILIISSLFFICSKSAKSSIKHNKRVANSKRAASVSGNGKRGNSNGTSAKISSSNKVSSKRLASGKVSSKRLAQTNRNRNSTNSATDIVKTESVVNEVVETNLNSEVGNETLSNILEEIKFIKDILTLQSQNIAVLSSYNVNMEQMNMAEEITEENETAPQYTGKIFKSATITLNENQGYYLSDIVDETNLSKYDETKFYFSRCGFNGYFSVPKKECFASSITDMSKHLECMNSPYTIYTLSEDRGFSPNTSYNLNNAFVSWSDGRSEYPISLYGEKYGDGNAVYIKYDGLSAKNCPGYNFVKAVTSDGVEDFVKINIREVNNMPYTSGSMSKLTWTGKVMKSANLQLKEGQTYKLKDILNLPAYNSKDKYGRALNSVFVYVSNCGMATYDGRTSYNGTLEDGVGAYSLAYGKEMYLMSANDFSSASVTVLDGASDKCKTNFIYIGSSRQPQMIYTDAAKIEFIKN